MGLELFFIINHYHHSIIYFYSILLVLVKGSSSIMDVLVVCMCKASCKCLVHEVSFHYSVFLGWHDNECILELSSQESLASRVWGGGGGAT